ncbi:MAG: hypothetical protein JW395_1585 [Nitrospira sp.]|nr:hypothetical protein [Nitrospira sp.]
MSLLKIAGPILNIIAPTIATALGGPIAGMAVRAITSALGLGSDASKEDIANAITGAGPDQIAALKKAEYDFKVQMKQLDIDLERIAADDRDSARTREASTKDWVPRVLGTIIIAGFLGTVYMVLAGYVVGMKDPMMATTVGTLIGYVSAKADQVISYYFGSTASSSEKNALLAKKYQ